MALCFYWERGKGGGGFCSERADRLQKDYTEARTPECLLSPRISHPRSCVDFIAAPQHSWASAVSQRSPLVDGGTLSDPSPEAGKRQSRDSA